MEYSVGAANHWSQRRGISDIHVVELDLAAHFLEIRFVTSEEIVDHCYASAFEKGPDHGGADETSASGHYKFQIISHECSLRFQTSHDDQGKTLPGHQRIHAPPEPHRLVPQ